MAYRPLISSPTQTLTRRPGAGRVAWLVIAMLATISSAGCRGDHTPSSSPTESRRASTSGAGRAISTPLTGSSRPARGAFDDGGVRFVYPAGWTVTGFSRTVSPRRLVVASYPVDRSQVEGDCGGSAALAALPRSGAAILLIDYGAGPRMRFFARQRHPFQLADATLANYECFGHSYAFLFYAEGHNLQAHILYRPGANRSERRATLKILDSLVKPAPTSP